MNEQTKIVDKELALSVLLEQLFTFYSVKSIEELIVAQNKHVETLQEKLRKNSQADYNFTPNQLRKG